MKHIFSVHSPITFLVAYATINQLRLRKDEVIILSATYNVPINEFRVIPSFYEAKNRTVWQKIRNFNVPRGFDHYINQYLDGQEFIAYIDLMSYYQKILITHQKCKGFHFIEEGNGTYQKTDDITDIIWHERKMDWRTKGILNFKTLFRTLRGYNLKLFSLPYIYTAYANMENTKFYAFSNNAYNCVDPAKRILLQPDKSDATYKELAGGYILENATVWMDGSNARYTGLDESYYYDAIKRSIPILRAKGVLKDKVYAKLRPGVTDYSANKLVSILEQHNIEVEVMPNSMVVEAFLLTSRNCNVIGVMTSSLEYAYAFGHKAYSIYGLFEKQAPTPFDRMKGYWENIENLRPNNSKI